MSAAQAQRSDVALVDVLPQHRFDEQALWKYLQAQLDDFAGPAELRQFQGGQSNPTFLIQTPTKKFVLRKKPPGKLLPSAHLVEREYRILRALPGTDVPVPAARLLCEDPAIIGTSFYVMDHVEGRVITAVTLPQLTPAERASVYSDYARIGARLHAVDFRAVGLGDFGKPEGYIARQLDRWTKQYLASKTEENADMERLIAWLAANLPGTDETAIVHGDYRIGNTIIHPTQPRIIAVLDWELATLGHPLSDLAYACRSEEHTSELQSLAYLVCRLLLEKKKEHIWLSRYEIPVEDHPDVIVLYDALLVHLLFDVFECASATVYVVTSFVYYDAVAADSCQ